MDRRAGRDPAVTALRGVQRSWLAAVNLAVAVFVGLPFLAPVLLALGYDAPANAIYAAYAVVCHQWPFRSYFLFGPHAVYGAVALGALIGQDATYSFVGSPELGYKVAFCERDVAIYLAVLLAGLAYGRWRGRLPSLGLAGYAVMILPMAVDGVTQVFGWRESTVELRTVTGALFGVASVWLIYPRVDALFERDLASLPAPTAGPSARPA
jgi:uncharacterized membrane protein